VDAVGLAALTPVLHRLPDLRLIITLEPDLSVDGFSGTVIDVKELRATGAPAPDHEPGLLETFLILYTSGTTGASKGCMLSQTYMVRVGNVMSEMLEVVDDDVQMCVHPLFHMSGHMDVAIALMTGTPVGLENSFSAGRFFPRAKELGATFWGGPGISDILLTLPATKDHKLRRWIGLPFSPQAAQTMLDKFGIASICQGYAQTEANPVATVGLNTPGAPDTNGWIVPDLECQVVDDNDFPVPVGDVGEIVIRPKVPGAMFSGYWNDAERTIEAWRNLWHHTGDLGRFDEAGHLTFVDRKSDSMRRKGENISAMELERALLEFGGIAEVAVHSVRVADQAEDDIKACIVLAPDAQFDPARFGEFVTETVPHFAVVRYYELFEALPRNPIGRVQKFELRQRGLTGSTVDMFALGHTSDRRRK
jgi:crotonobetaine/carnitine-CoA ligase